MNALDDDYLNRAAPPGSMRYFALLYAAPEQRDALQALFVIDSEIGASVHAAHEVAHTRLQWWRAEIDRLINRNAQHPATKLLQAALPNADFALLHERMTAADMELARMTYGTASELEAYLVRSTLTLRFPDDSASSRALSIWIRRIETLRDLAMDVRDGRIYWPLNELDTAGVTVDALRAHRMTDAIRSLLAAETEKLGMQFESIRQQASGGGRRSLIVLADLHRKLLRQIAAADYDVFTQRHELKPLQKVWIAWRAARKT